MSLDFTDDQSTLVQVMAWCHQATSHYLSQCWLRSLSPYGITRPQWVDSEKCWVGWHRKLTVIWIPTFSLVGATEIVIKKQSVAISNAKVGIMTILRFQRNHFNTVLTTQQPNMLCQHTEAWWWYITVTTLAQVTAGYLAAPIHYLKQCWLIISSVHSPSFEGNFTSTLNH